MKQYLDTVKQILEEGTRQPNRTGIDTISMPGAMMKFDLSKGFPAITTRRMPFKSAVGELIGFMRGTRSAKDFRDLGCKVWDQNANENKSWLANPYRLGEDDLGRFYGVQWREWNAFKVVPVMYGSADPDETQWEFLDIVHSQSLGDNENGFMLYHKKVDQIAECINTILTNPNDRRIIFHAWNPAELDEMSLPPCHLLYQFHPNPVTKELSMTLYIRSNDFGLGTPFNITEGAAMLSLFAKLTGYKPKWFTYFVGDAHVYVNHLDMLNEMFAREPLPSPQLKLSDNIPDFSVDGKYDPEWMHKIKPSDFELVGYEHHPALTAPMAV